MYHAYQVAFNIYGQKSEAYPVPSETSLEIFIFFVVPLNKSSKLHGKVRSIIAPFLGGILVDPSPPPPVAPLILWTGSDHETLPCLQMDLAFQKTIYHLHSED